MDKRGEDEAIAAMESKDALKIYRNG